MTRFLSLKWLVPVAVALLALPGVLLVLGGSPAASVLVPPGWGDGDARGGFGGAAFRGAAPEGAGVTDAAPVAMPGFTAPAFVSQDGFEPSVRVDSRGIVYVAFANGFPGASEVYRSEDAGENWFKLESPPLAPGAEPSIQVGPGDALYFSDLTLQGSVLAKYDADGALECFQHVGQTSAAVDRQWILVSERGELWLNTNDIGRGIYQYYTPDPCLVPTTKPVPLTFGPHSSSFPAYDAVTGSTYTFYEQTALVTTSDSLLTRPLADGFWVARTEAPDAVTPEGLGVAGRSLVEHGVTGRSNVFLVGAVDDAGNVYVTWSVIGEDGGEQVYYAWSPPGGASWSDAVLVSEGAGSAVFPWIDARGNGEVAITWLESGDARPAEEVEGTWRVRLAKSVNATSTDPAFTVVDATGTMHKGSICLSGTGCGASPPWTIDRDLGDYIQVALGPDGKAHVAYTDDYDPANGVDTGLTKVMYVRET